MSASLQAIGRGTIAPGNRKKTIGIERAVVLSPFFWNFRDDMWQTTHHIARAVARRVPTLFVEPPVQWNPRSEEFRWHRIYASSFGRRMETAGPGLDVFHRRGFPLGRLEAFRKFQGERNARALERLLPKNGAGGTMLWHSFPYWSEPLTEAVDHELFVYHCLDYSPREEERRLVGRADVVFCVSQALVEKYKAVNPQTFLLPNGVDLDLFDPERAARFPRPADLPERGPILGFIGYLNCHADLEVIAAVAKAYPQCKVVLMGRIAKGHAGPQGRQLEALDELKSLPNVSLPGFRPPHQLPAYLHAFDVCLIPLLRNRFNQERDPMKFYQYMAMGKPVVTTPVPVARRYPHACYAADTHDEFVAAIGEALARSGSVDEQQARRAIARRHSWPVLVDRAWQIIAQRRRGLDPEEIPECT
ncbi:MAG TPA: glycosyltransferase [Candidatus Dormibacteraeota bacterium]|nr:glycosyltransferase [Candidatus Dormibacteraeota bacterium]